jgi:opacity protein-like surface antigen
MKKFVLLLVVAAFAASPAAAASKPKKSKEAAEAEEIAKQHDNTRRALRDALPLVLPTWSLPFYFGMHLDETKERKDKEVKGHRHRQSSSSSASNR